MKAFLKNAKTGTIISKILNIGCCVHSWPQISNIIHYERWRTSWQITNRNSRELKITEVCPVSLSNCSPLLAIVDRNAREVSA